MADRLIINRNGESARAMQVLRSTNVRVQCNALLHYENKNTGQVTMEVEFAPREAVALALQILDAAGYAAEIQPFGPLSRALGAPDSLVKVTDKARALSHTEQLGKGKR